MTATVVLSLSIALGLCIPVVAYWTYTMDVLDRRELVLFGVGVLLGGMWELALGVVVPRRMEMPLYTVFPDVMVPRLVHVIAYSLWDGALFLLGVLLVTTLLDGRAFRRFRWGELGILVAWGQLQSLAIEVLAVTTGLWTYHPTAWNPALFELGDGTITVLPKAIWLLAVLVFYPCCLFVYRAGRTSTRS
jgi:hypothetical protein